jgi:hypothetical protein
MAGTIKTQVQLGDSATAANNFTLTSAAADGTMKLSRGNAGATTQDIMTVDAAGNMSLLNGRRLVESGSNANGRWTRWADGTQTCTFGSALIFQNSSNLGFIWIFPAAFSETPVAAASLTDGGSLATTKALTYTGAYSASATQASISVLSQSIFVPADVTGRSLSVSAIGRWY